MPALPEYPLQVAHGNIGQGRMSVLCVGSLLRLQVVPLKLVKVHVVPLRYLIEQRSGRDLHDA